MEVDREKSECLECGEQNIFKVDDGGMERDHRGEEVKRQEESQCFWTHRGNKQCWPSLTHKYSFFWLLSRA